MDTILVVEGTTTNLNIIIKLLGYDYDIISLKRIA